MLLAIVIVASCVDWTGWSQRLLSGGEAPGENAVRGISESGVSLENSGDIRSKTRRERGDESGRSVMNWVGAEDRRVWDCWREGVRTLGWHCVSTG